MLRSNRTVTYVQTQTKEEEKKESIPQIVIRPGLQVVWDPAVVDNEHLGRKSSKVCCIYRKPRTFPFESDSESSDDDCDCKKNAYERVPHHHHRNSNGKPDDQKPNLDGTL